MEKIFDFLDYVVYCGQQSVLPVKRGFVVFRVCFVIEAIWSDDLISLGIKQPWLPPPPPPQPPVPPSPTSQKLPTIILL